MALYHLLCDLSLPLRGFLSPSPCGLSPLSLSGFLLPTLTVGIFSFFLFSLIFPQISIDLPILSYPSSSAYTGRKSVSPICGFGCYLLCSVGLTSVGLGAGLAKPSAVWFGVLIDSSASIKCLFWMVGLATINPR